MKFQQSFPYWKGMIEFMQTTNLPSILLKLIRLNQTACINKECEGTLNWPNGDPFIWSEAGNLYGIRTLDFSDPTHDAAVLTQDMRIEGTLSSSQHASICQSECEIQDFRCPKPNNVINDASVSTNNIDQYLAFPRSFTLR